MWTCATHGETPACNRKSNAQVRCLLAFHVCDGRNPATDLLNDRGMRGDGVVETPKIRGWVEAEGFAGYSEVEIFPPEAGGSGMLTRCCAPAKNTHAPASKHNILETSTCNFSPHSYLKIALQRAPYALLHCSALLPR